MPILNAALTGWAVIALVMTLLWMWQKSSRKAGIVDVARTLATGLLGMWFAWSVTGYLPRKTLVMVLAGGWAMRLGLHLLRRVLIEPEDGRYQSLRSSSAVSADPKLFMLFQVQAVWAVIFATSMYAAAANPTRGLGMLDLAGALLAFAAIQGEMVADRQLARFRRDQANRTSICVVGLWRYSRHPNYFFEWLHWWSYALIAIGSPLWWMAALNVMLMLLFLTKLRGIPGAERQALRSRGDAYAEYQRTTSAFIPWRRKNAGS